MPLYFTMHMNNPQPRLIRQAAEVLLSGELIAYPTDSSYAIGCMLTSPSAHQAMRRLRGMEEKHPLTLLCNSISQAAHYCIIADPAFAILKQLTPGPYTFILPAQKSVPRLAQGIKRKVVGVRIPQHAIPLALIDAIETPLLSTTLWLPGDETPICDPEEIIAKTKGKVAMILDGGLGGEQATTIIDLAAGEQPVLIRKGLGIPLCLKVSE